MGPHRVKLALVALLALGIAGCLSPIQQARVASSALRGAQAATEGLHAAGKLDDDDALLIEPIDLAARDLVNRMFELAEAGQADVPLGPFWQAARDFAGKLAEIHAAHAAAERRPVKRKAPPPADLPPPLTVQP